MEHPLPVCGTFYKLRNRLFNDEPLFSSMRLPIPKGTVVRIDIGPDLLTDWSTASTRKGYTVGVMPYDLLPVSPLIQLALQTETWLNP